MQCYRKRPHHPGQGRCISAVPTCSVGGRSSKKDALFRACSSMSCTVHRNARIRRQFVYRGRHSREHGRQLAACERRPERVAAGQGATLQRLCCVAPCHLMCAPARGSWSRSESASAVRPAAPADAPRTDTQLPRAGRFQGDPKTCLERFQVGCAPVMCGARRTGGGLAIGGSK